MKPFELITHGDITVSVEFNEDVMGPIVWCGTYEQLLQSEYSTLLEEDEFYPCEYKWVVVQCPFYGKTLFNYNCDPSGVVVL